MYVFHLIRETGAMRLQAVVPVMTIFLEHRPTTAMVHQDRVVAIKLKGHEIGIRQPSSTERVTVVKVNGTAAALSARLILKDKPECQK